MTSPASINAVLLGCNWAGIVVLVIACAVTFGCEALSGETREGLLMMILGPCVFVCDAAYRKLIVRATMLSYEPGGIILWMPAWFMGLVWTCIGGLYTLQGTN